MLHRLEAAGMGRRSTFRLGLSWRNHQRAAWHVKRRHGVKGSWQLQQQNWYSCEIFQDIRTIIRKLLWLSMIISMWVFTDIYFNQSTCNDPHWVTAGKVVSPVKKLQVWPRFRSFLEEFLQQRKITSVVDAGAGFIHFDKFILTNSASSCGYEFMCSRNLLWCGYGSKLFILQIDAFQLNTTILVGHLVP